MVWIQWSGVIWIYPLSFAIGFAAERARDKSSLYEKEEVVLGDLYLLTTYCLVTKFESS